MAIRRDVFLDLGGFEPAFAGASIEDIALGYRMVLLGHRIRFVPDIQLVHLKGYTLAQMVRSDIFHRAIPWTGLIFWIVLIAVLGILFAIYPAWRASKLNVLEAISYE